MPKLKEETPKNLRPYLFWGCDLDWADGENAKGECPFCGKPKFSVEVATGKYRCWVCGTGNDKGGGNAITFLRKIYEGLDAGEGALTPFAEDRQLLSWRTLAAWGCVVDRAGRLCVPAFATDGRLTNLYRWEHGPNGKMLLKSTRSDESWVKAGLFGVPLFDKRSRRVFVCEGPWDAMALWEALRTTRIVDGRASLTSSVEASVGAACSVVGVPGAGAFQERWADLLDGRDVALMFDSDPPRTVNGRAMDGAGFAGTKRTAAMLARTEGRPSSLAWLAWGDGGHDPDLAPGYDVRDALKDGEGADRCRMLAELLDRVKPIPADWNPGRRKPSRNGEVGLECLPCSDLKTLLMSWKKALKWTPGLEKGLICMLATSTSTMSLGDQLWMRMLGPPSCIASTSIVKFVVRRKSDGRLVNKKGGTIATLWKRFHNQPGDSRWKTDVEYFVQSVNDDGVVVRNKIENVIVKGVQTVYRLTTASGKRVETTADHEFMVKGGYRRLDELSKGDTVYVNPGVVRKKGRAKYPRRPEITVKYHPSGREKVIQGRFRYFRLKVYQAVYEAVQNGMTYTEYVRYLNTAPVTDINRLWTIPAGMHVHHKDENPANNAYENLQLIDASSHGLEHLDNAIKQVAIEVEEDRVVSITKVGKKVVYDIVVANPYRNFVADGVVLHNCGKSTLAEALAVNRHYVLALSTLRGLHSGYDDGSGENYSPLAKMKDKCVIVKDGDTMMKSPNLEQLLSELRDVYDRVSRSSYRNKMSKNWDGLNISKILCGTGSLRALDTSELGERYLTCVIAKNIDPELERTILRRKLHQAARGMALESDGTPESQHTPELLEAYQLTGGYVAWLRQNARELLSTVSVPEAAYQRLEHLALFVAHLRARPSVKQAELVEREMAPRLGSQLIRLAMCAAVVMNRPSVDEDVMAIVSEVARDTAEGRTAEIVRALRREGDEGASSGFVAAMTGHPEDAEKRLLRFLRQIGVAEPFKPEGKTTTRWRLTPTMVELWDEVVG